MHDTQAAFIIAAATIKEASERPLTPGLVTECQSQVRRLADLLERLVEEVTAVV